MNHQKLRQKNNVLIVEDDGYCRFFLSDLFKAAFGKILCVDSVTQAFEIVQENDFDLIIVNLKAVNQNELRPVSRLHQNIRDIPVVVVSDRDNVDFAVEVLRAGAYDYLTKPFNSIARVEKAINGALIQRRNLRESALLAQREVASHGLIGESIGMKSLLSVISQIGPLNVNVLITGESGTGKELVARAVHGRSNRRSGPFFPVNCGAVPEGLMESIFFGHEKGSFTGATQSHEGFIEKALNGTLFLDEVGELSSKGQVALLRFLQEREFLRVGGVKRLVSNARIIASTNRDLEQEVTHNRFRADLFFRLNVVHLRVPPLRDRGEDVVNLANYFTKRFSLANGLPEPKLTAQALKLLEQYDWPGNVRELENLMERLVAMLSPKKAMISPKDILNHSTRIEKALTQKHQTGCESMKDQDYKQAFREFEALYFRTILEKHQGNVTRAARTAGIHAVTLHRKLRKLGIVSG
ncbi:MAG: sigma-54 dependent transcriptional regulator [Pseudomonadota bacterium]